MKRKIVFGIVIVFVLVVTSLIVVNITLLRKDISFSSSQPKTINVKITGPDASGALVPIPNAQIFVFIYDPTDSNYLKYLFKIMGYNTLVPQPINTDGTPGLPINLASTATTNANGEVVLRLDTSQYPLNNDKKVWIGVSAYNIVPPKDKSELTGYDVPDPQYLTFGINNPDVGILKFELKKDTLGQIGITAIYKNKKPAVFVKEDVGIIVSDVLRPLDKTFAQNSPSTYLIGVMGIDLRSNFLAGKFKAEGLLASSVAISSRKVGLVLYDSPESYLVDLDGQKIDVAGAVTTGSGIAVHMGIPKKDPFGKDAVYRIVFKDKWGNRIPALEIINPGVYDAPGLVDYYYGQQGTKKMLYIKARPILGENTIEEQAKIRLDAMNPN